MSGARTGRLLREIKMLENKPPWGIICKPAKDDVLDELKVEMLGLKGSPYEKGTFKLYIIIPDKYPNAPPQVKFITSVYHPNIDQGGRICMNMLKMPPNANGSWLPTITIEALLVSIQLLLANPNPDDPLMPNIAYQYKYEKEKFLEEAKKNTEKYAV